MTLATVTDSEGPQLGGVDPETLYRLEASLPTGCLGTDPVPIPATATRQSRILGWRQKKPTEVRTEKGSPVQSHSYVGHKTKATSEQTNKLTDTDSWMVVPGEKGGGGDAEGKGSETGWWRRPDFGRQAYNRQTLHRYCNCTPEIHKTASTNVTPVNFIFKNHTKGGGGSQAFLRMELCDSPSPVCHFPQRSPAPASDRACLRWPSPAGQRHEGPGRAGRHCAGPLCRPELEPETVAGAEEGLSICQVGVNFRKTLPVSPRHVQTLKRKLQNSKYRVVLILWNKVFTCMSITNLEGKYRDVNRGHLHVAEIGIVWKIYIHNC